MVNDDFSSVGKLKEHLRYQTNASLTACSLQIIWADQSKRARFLWLAFSPQRIPKAIRCLQILYSIFPFTRAILYNISHIAHTINRMYSSGIVRFDLRNFLFFFERRVRSPFVLSNPRAVLWYVQKFPKRIVVLLQIDLKSATPHFWSKISYPILLLKRMKCQKWRTLTFMWGKMVQSCLLRTDF